jgi:hypothetical protein
VKFSAAALIPPRPADYDLVILLVPCEHGIGPYAEFLASGAADYGCSGAPSGSKRRISMVGGSSPYAGTVTSALVRASALR